MGCGVPIIHSSHPHIVDSRLLLSLTLHSLHHLLLDLIHDTQTGFVHDRRILNNIFTFLEATEWAQHSGQHLAILLLDFEKAYDRVD